MYIFLIANQTLLWFLEWGRAKKRKRTVTEISVYWRRDILGNLALLSSCSSSVICQPLSLLPFSAEQTRLLLADKWLPYGLLPFHLLLFSKLRNSEEQAASLDCTTLPCPCQSHYITAKRRASREDHSLSSDCSRSGSLSV